MNKRIQELAEQAGLSYMPSNYPDMADLYKCADFELEKFAELIIQECIHKARIVQEQEVGASDDYLDGREMGLEVLILNLKGGLDNGQSNQRTRRAIWHL